MYSGIKDLKKNLAEILEKQEADKVNAMRDDDPNLPKFILQYITNLGPDLSRKLSMELIRDPSESLSNNLIKLIALNRKIR